MAQASWAQGEPLRWVELVEPVPGPRELRVRVRAVGVNPVDWKMRAQGPLRLAARLIGPPPPVVVGVDFAGEVDAVGEGVRGLAVGARVVGGTDFSRGQRGSYADTVLVREDQVALLPEEIPWDVAAALPVPGCTAWLCLEELGRVRRGGRVLVLGASGGVGQLTLPLARAAGALAYGVCSTKNLELVQGLGADGVIDYTAAPALEQAERLGPFQLIVDCVGGYSAVGCRFLLEPGGRHLMVAASDWRGVVAAVTPPFNSHLVLGRPTRARLSPVVAAVRSGAVKVNISQRLPLEAAEEALALSQTGRQTGKLVLLP